MAKVNVAASILGRLACSLGRRDEAPNIELANTISKSNDRNAVVALVGLIESGTKPVRSNAIKVLYEIGERNPGLIAGFVKEFVAASLCKDNRLVWGALTALDAIAKEDPKSVYANLDQILDAAHKGSVIAKDHAVNILIKRASKKQYSALCCNRLLQQLSEAANNQFPMYCERAAGVLSQELYRARFAKLMSDRINRLEKESQKRRIQKVLSRMKPRSQ